LNRLGNREGQVWKIINTRGAKVIGVKKSGRPGEIIGKFDILV
jgi:hypothetical protein